MNIVACIKRVPLTEIQVKVGADNQSLDSSGYEYMLSFYDEIALEEAVKTKESLGGEVTVLTIGPGDATKEMRECLAKGADKGVILTDDDWGARDCRSTAKALAAQIQGMGADVVFCGRLATDRDNAAVGPMLATYLGWACATDVIGVELSEGSGTARRETETGVDTLQFDLPAVITCNKGLNEPRYAGLKGIMAAKKKPLEEVAFEGEANQASIVSIALPPPRKEGRIIGEGVEAVGALVDALHNEAKVL